MQGRWGRPQRGAGDSRTVVRLGVRMQEDEDRPGEGPTESEDAMTEPAAFEVYEEGVYLHGTRALLAPGEMLTPAQPSNFRTDAPLQYVYVTQTLHAAAWGAQLARCDGDPRVYVVEPIGELEDDPTSPTSGCRATRRAPTGRSSRCRWCVNSRTGPGTARRALRRCGRGSRSCGGRGGTRSSSDRVVMRDLSAELRRPESGSAIARRQSRGARGARAPRG